MDQDSAGIAVTYYTDPLCPWSWGLEPQWRRLRYEYADRLVHRYVMGGMIPDWRSYHDPVNAVRNPGQMAVQWFESRRMTGMPTDDRIWRDDPPASSYPACLAVKAAEPQGPAAAESYLRRLREAAMAECRDVARGEVLLEIADELAGDGLLDADRFREDLVAPGVADAFHEDLREIRYRDIRRFPTLVFRAGDGPGVAVVGHRPYAVLLAVMDRLCPGIAPACTASDAAAYVGHWGRASVREVAEALGLDDPSALEALGRAADVGTLEREGDASGWFRAPRRIE